MASIRQIGIIGNSIKTNALPTPSESTYATGNRFYTLTSAQDGYEVGHTYRTIINENNEYVWEDIETAGLKLAIPVSEKGQPNGVAELNENGIVPSSQLPTIPTTTSQLQNDSDFATNESVDEKVAALVNSAPEALDTLGELATALENHEDAYGALLEAIGNKANKDEIITDYNGLSNRPIINANLIGTSNPTTGVYYRHVGSTNDIYTKGVIYYYNGEKYNAIAGNERCVHYVSKATFEVEQGAANLSMKWTLDDIDGITEPVPGMTVAIQIPDTSIHASGVVMSIDGGATYHPVLRNKVTALTNAYPEEVIVVFVYNDLASTRAYLETGVQTTITGCWQVSDYDSDRLVQQTSTSTNTPLPLLLRPVDANTTTTTTTQSTTYYNKDIWANPATGELNAKDFLIEGNSVLGMLGGGSGGGGTSSGMPVIRLINVSTYDRSGIVSPDLPVRVTIQVLDGTILPTDEIQLCSRKAMTYKKYDTGVEAEPTKTRGRRWRYRRINGKSGQECHPDRSMEDGIYRMICWDEGDAVSARQFLRSDNYYKSHRVVTKYIRVSRMVDETFYHSNAIPIQFCIEDLVKPEKEEAKISVR